MSNHPSDIFFDFLTPEVTSDEDDEISLPEDDGFCQRMLSLDCVPTVECVYSDLYQDPAYLHAAEKKLILLKEDLKVRHSSDPEDIRETRDSRTYQDELEKLKTKYPVTGGRDGIYELLALFYSNLLFGLEEEDDNNDEDDNDDDNNDNDRGNDNDKNENDKKNDMENKENQKSRKRKANNDILNHVNKLIRL